MILRRAALALAALLLAPGGLAAQDAPARVPVVATFSILADVAREVGGERVLVSALVGPDQDAHAYEPSPADAARLSEARLVIANGLGFEGWIDRLIKAAGSGVPPVIASRGVKPIQSAGHGHGHGHGHSDPHAFQNVANVKLYVANIRDGLSRVDPAGRPVFEANAARYLAELDRLESEIRAGIGRIPPANRRVITSHDSFSYYGAAYGLRFVAPRGISSQSEISARDIATIVRQIRAEKIPAVFLENVTDARLMDRIAKESGARIGGKLYSDALSGPDGPAASYLAMMRQNLRTLLAALAD
ncbi:metal ABC transporter substrate-binding protein [Enterovirga sp.]|uniref:metal ABC transporter substrate-binding protein n=1 Tax=Enterovirga sp. TaxID=2026350 RepID=UPI00260FD8A8|nr:metal ABC transporter substrate-binding protein [Enterovirga sp.]